MLEALVERCTLIKTSEPEIGTNRGLYGFTRLPFELQTALGN